MTFTNLVRRYQRYDRATGEFATERSISAYAREMGLNPSVLSRFYTGDRRNSWTVLRAFLRAFPEARAETPDAIAHEEPADAVAVPA